MPTKNKNNFTVAGKVAKNIYHKSGDGWVLTNFLVNVPVGESKGTTIYNNFPISCWFDADVKEGQFVKVEGNLRMTKDRNTGKYLVQLIADKHGITFANGREVERAENADEGFYGNAFNSSLHDSNIPF